MNKRRSLPGGTGICVGVFMPLAFGVFFCSCTHQDQGEDSWADFQAGGMFNTTAPSISPDGQQLVYASACTGQGDIYVMKNGASHPVRLTDDRAFESSPFFTPDGKRIAFFRERDGRRHIWIMNADGSQQRQLTDANALDDPQSFSADGRYLLFRRAEISTGLGRAGWSYVMRIDVANSSPVKVGSIAVLHPDGGSVVFWEGDSSLWQLELDKGKKRRRFPGRGWPLGFSADGRYLLTGRSVGGPDDQIWVRDLKNNSEKRIADGHSTVIFGVDSYKVLYSKGYNQEPFVPYVTTIDGDTTTRVECSPACKETHRVCLGGKGALLRAFPSTGDAHYDVIFVASDDLQATNMASVGSDRPTFNWPSPLSGHLPDSASPRD